MLCRALAFGRFLNQSGGRQVQARRKGVEKVLASLTADIYSQLYRHSARALSAISLAINSSIDLPTAHHPSVEDPSGYVQALARYEYFETISFSKDDKGNAFAMSGMLKIRVDRDKCQGHARCKSLAPELFDLDEFGNARERGDGSVPAGLEDKAWLARSNCPEIAIEVIEE
jgi:ferredoxin